MSQIIAKNFVRSGSGALLSVRRYHEKVVFYGKLSGSKKNCYFVMQFEMAYLKFEYLQKYIFWDTSHNNLSLKRSFSKFVSNFKKKFLQISHKKIF